MSIRKYSFMCDTDTWLNWKIDVELNKNNEILFATKTTHITHIIHNTNTQINFNRLCTSKLVFISCFCVIIIVWFIFPVFTLLSVRIFYSLLNVILIDVTVQRTCQIFMYLLYALRKRLLTLNFSCHSLCLCSNTNVSGKSQSKQTLK